jgi:hypothetical protein
MPESDGPTIALLRERFDARPFRVSEAVEAGVSRTTVHRLRRSGALEAAGRGVVRLAGAGMGMLSETEMDARVKGGVGVCCCHGGGCGCWGRATVAAATTTVTLRCAGRDRRTVSGRELPRTRVASRDRIDQSRVLREVAAVARPQQDGGLLRRRPPGRGAGWWWRSAGRVAGGWRRPRGTRRVRGRRRRSRRWSVCRAR